MLCYLEKVREEGPQKVTSILFFLHITVLANIRKCHLSFHLLHFAYIWLPLHHSCQLFFKNRQLWHQKVPKFPKKGATISVETTNLVIFKSAKHLVFWELWTTEQVHKTNSINLFYKCKKVNTWNDKWPFLMFPKTVLHISFTNVIRHHLDGAF